MVTYAKGTLVKVDGSLLTPDQIHSLSNSDALHVIQDYLANSVALATGHDMVVTGAYRDPKESPAHARGSIDIRAPQTHAERMAWAKIISNQLPHNAKILVLVEEPTQMPDGSIHQLNTYFHDGVQTAQLPGIQKPSARRGKNDQFHARGTHMHIQVPPGFSVPDHYPVALRTNGESGSELHYSNGAIYKGPLKGGAPTGQGEQVNPDGVIWTGDFTNGFASSGHWRQTTPDGSVTDITISDDGSEDADLFASGQYENFGEASFKDGLPKGHGAFTTRAGSSFGNSASRFEGDFYDGILSAHRKTVYEHGDVAEGDNAILVQSRLGRLPRARHTMISLDGLVCRAYWEKP